MSQRLGIAAALLGDPATLLFDEPVNGLDPEGIRWIRTLMRKLADEGRTVVVSSHLMNEMEETADHVIVIGRGRLIADTSMTEFRLRGAGSHVRVISPDAARLAELLDRAGGQVTFATRRRDDLHRRRPRCRADRRSRRRARPARARADTPLGQPRGGVHGAHARQRRLPAGGDLMTPFSVTLRSEWTKLASLRGTSIKLQLAFVLSVGLTALLALIVGATWDDASAADRASHDPAGVGLFGSLFSMIVFAVLGATAVTSEYGSGMIRMTLTATPRRGRVLAAKAAVVAAITLVAGPRHRDDDVPRRAGCLRLLRRADREPGGRRRAARGARRRRPDAGPARSSRSRSASRRAVPRVPSPRSSRRLHCRGSSAACCRVVARQRRSTTLPGAAAEAITSGHLESATEGLLAPGLAALVLAGWLALFLGAAWLVLERRDA